MKIRYRRGKRLPWSIELRFMGVTRGFHAHTFCRVVGMLWRGAISPTAIRRRRAAVAFYRSGWSRAAWNEIHGAPSRGTDQP